MECLTLSEGPGFAPFPRLPLEIQLKIFALTWPAGQRIVVSCTEVHTSSEATAPATLYVCSNSREETLRSFRCIGFQSSLTRRPQWFQSKADTLYLHACVALSPIFLYWRHNHLRQPLEAAENPFRHVKELHIYRPLWSYNRPSPQIANSQYDPSEKLVLDHCTELEHIFLMVADGASTIFELAEDGSGGRPISGKDLNGMREIAGMLESYLIRRKEADGTLPVPRISIRGMDLA
ncbi:hypothetical protein HYFRA_00011635 [Hymenoscyphus fraxineus]|uniref:2EXR domain-containing protein n=1 Tax=Hymenoscyphus fraxineus TaxID=746836 RepID=A0A9N9KXJ4_9HELO|nr:hypothetical protein HYFRA_00011635 [Hymenoscyphus fraxineus]